MKKLMSTYKNFMSGIFYFLFLKQEQKKYKWILVCCYSALYLSSPITKQIVKILCWFYCFSNTVTRTTLLDFSKISNMFETEYIEVISLLDWSGLHPVHYGSDPFTKPEIWVLDKAGIVSPGWDLSPEKEKLKM